MIQRYTRAIRARSCGIRRIWQRQSAIPCAKLSTHLASHESHPDTLDIGTIVAIRSISIGHRGARYWSLILSGKRRISSSRILFRWDISRNYVLCLIFWWLLNCCCGCLFENKKENRFVDLYFSLYLEIWILSMMIILNENYSMILSVS